MDFTERYRIVESRDRRFDGQFVLAVRTTGIYCRPSCPARTPKPANVRFFATGAAAHLAGYRACRRCLPETTPGSPEWNLRQDVAGRAMRLIADGYVDRHGVSGLANHLGYSQRHVNRVLTDELGAGALPLARAHRAQTGRHLLSATEMAVSDIAFASGFASIRQFNDTMTDIFGITPTQIRRKAHAPVSPTAMGRPGVIHLKLAYRAPIDAAGLFAWFKARAIDGVEVATATSYARTLRTNYGTAIVDIVQENDGTLVVKLRLAHLSELGAVLQYVRRLFDLDADPNAVDSVLTRDARLAGPVRDAPGIRIPGAVDATEILTRAIIGQQVTVSSARRHLDRLVAATGEPLPTELTHETGWRLFPDPESIADRAGRLVRGPRRRTETLVQVCQLLADGKLPMDVSTGKEELISRLTQIRGIGPWTAHYVALRFLGHPDVLVPKDVAIGRGARRLGFTDLAADAEKSSPWRSYVSMHLWRQSAIDKE